MGNWESGICHVSGTFSHVPTAIFNTPLECGTWQVREITHDGTPELQEVFLVAHLLGEKVSRVESAGDVDGCDLFHAD